MQILAHGAGKVWDGGMRNLLSASSKLFEAISLIITFRGTWIQSYMVMEIKPFGTASKSLHV